MNSRRTMLLLIALPVLAGVAVVTGGSASASRSDAAVDPAGTPRRVPAVSQPVPPEKLHAAKARFAGKPAVRPGEVRYTGVGARLVPNADSRAAAVTAAEALATFERSGLRSDVRSIKPHVRLVRFSDDTFGEEQPDGTVRLFFQDRLAWTVTYPGARVAVRGPAGSSARQQPAGGCDFVYVVDAVSGEAMTAFQDCRAQRG